MKSKISILIVCAFVFTLYGCQKEPTASFTTNKSSYVAGEKIICTNTSVNAETFLWTYSDGQQNSAKDVSYTTSSNMAGEFTIELKCYSKNGELSDVYSKTISLEENPIHGYWTGTYTCSQGEAGCNLSIVRIGNLLKTIFSFYAIQSNPDVPSGSFKMEGEILDNEFTLFGTEWINRPAGYQMVVVDGLFNENDNTITGTICNNPFILIKQ